MSKAAELSKSGRIIWVDVLRFLGMTLIYWGHLAVSSNVTLYIYSHHVPLFFFISGFFATLDPTEGSFFKFLFKKIRTIVLPYVVFTILNYAFMLATGQLLVSELPQAFLISALGIRNRVPGPLWFLTCLFVIAVAFELIKRLVTAIFSRGKMQKFILILLAIVIYLVGILFLGHEPAQDPAWVWNVDSAFIYLLYYALGAAFFPLLSRLRFRNFKFFGKLFFIVFFLLAAGYGVLTILNGTAVVDTVQETFATWAAGAASAKVQAVLPAACFEIFGFFSAAIFIFLEIGIARMLAGIPGLKKFFAYLGKDSLYLCGNELFIKYAGVMVITAVGLTPLMRNDWFLLGYSILCIIVLVFTLDLLERLIFGKLFRNGAFQFGKKKK